MAGNFSWSMKDDQIARSRIVAKRNCGVASRSDELKSRRAKAEAHGRTSEESRRDGPPVLSTRSLVHPSVARLRPSWHRCSFNSAPLSLSISFHRSRPSFYFKVVSVALVRDPLVSSVHYGAPPGPRVSALNSREKRMDVGENDGSARSYEVTASDGWTDKLGSVRQRVSTVRVDRARVLERGSIERSMYA